MKPPSFTAEELLAQCRPSGVGRVNLIQMSFYEFDNRYMLDMIKLYPDRFVGTAIVDPLADDPGGAMEDSCPGAYGRSASSPSTASSRRNDGSRRQATGHVRDGCRNRPGPLVPDRLHWLSRSRSDVPAISRHEGDHRPPGADRRGRHDPRRRRSGPLRPGGTSEGVHQGRRFYALGKKTPPYLDLGPLIHRVVAAFGARRCMWESDCPFQIVSHRYEDSISLIRDRLDFLKGRSRLDALPHGGTNTFPVVTDDCLARDIE